MGKHFFTETDIVEALKASGTGMWRLETEPDKPIRFYGDSNMNDLIGVPDDMDPEERYKFFMRCVHEDDMKMFMAYYNALKNKEKAEVVYRYKHPEMGEIYVRCAGIKASEENGLICYRGFHQNVTDTIRIEQESRKRLTQQAEMYRSVAFKLMENFADATAKINLETGEFTWYTSDGGTLDEHPNYEQLFMDISKNVPEEYRDDFIKNASIENLRKQLSQKDSYQFASFVHRPEDWELRRLTYWYYVMDEDHKTVLSIYKDTTEDYLLEKQLADALLLAKQASEAKTVFLNNMSHDIRTPMNAIIGFTNLAQKYISDQEKCLDYLGKIQTSSTHLLSLINDVLDMSRIESGRVELHEEACDLHEMMEGLNTILQNDAKQRGIDFTVDDSELSDVYVSCDKLRLNQVLLNCASNAVKFTGQGGKISIVARQLPSTNEQDEKHAYQFVVSDTGIGMSEAFLQKLFEPFSREEKNVHQIQGTGLGMSICKKIVDLMGGSIVVESKEGVGSKFTITIFLQKVESDTKMDDEAAGENANGIKGKRLLLVEDNELNREIAVEILGEMGASIETACNGQEAVDMMAQSTIKYYDLILMDVQMPIMNGYEATEAIRRLKRADAKTVPILAMTANAFEEDKQTAIQCGMNGHLAKPIDVAEMMKVFATVVQ